MLPAAAQNLNAGGDLRALADYRLPQDAMAADVHARAKPDLRMGEKGAEGNAARKIAFRQRELVKRDAQVIPGDAGNQGVNVRE